MRFQLQLEKRIVWGRYDLSVALRPSTCGRLFVTLLRVLTGSCPGHVNNGARCSGRVPLYAVIARRAWDVVDVSREAHLAWYVLFVWVSSFAVKIFMRTVCPPIRPSPSAKGWEKRWEKALNLVVEVFVVLYCWSLVRLYGGWRIELGCGARGIAGGIVDWSTI